MRIQGRPAAGFAGGTVDSHGDHRIAMSFAIAMRARGRRSASWTWPTSRPHSRTSRGRAGRRLQRRHRPVSLSVASPIITIDGPSGSGKGTISRLVADRLGWQLLDSGALYRLVALRRPARGLSPDDEAGHADVAAAAGRAVRPGPTAASRSGWRRGGQLGDQDRAGGRGRLAGRGHAGGACGLLDRQRAFAGPPGWWPTAATWGRWFSLGAPLKIFLTAAPRSGRAGAITS